MEIAWNAPELAEICEMCAVVYCVDAALLCTTQAPEMS